MNLGEMISMVSQLLGDTKEEKVYRPEIIQFINMGQNIVSGVLVNIERESWLAIDLATIAQGSTDADSEFSLPTDLRHLVRLSTSISVGGQPVECVRWPAGNIASLLKNTAIQPLRGARHYCVELGGRTADYAPGQSRVRIYPNKVSGDLITLYYIKRGQEFKDVDVWDSTLTSAGSTTTFRDTTLPYSGGSARTGVTDAWVGAEVFFRTGAAKGQRSRVTAFAPGAAGSGTYGTCTVSPAFGVAPASGDSYALSKVSIIPPQHHHLICYYAAALGAPKVGLDPMEFMGHFENEMDRMRKKWIDNVTANVVGQIPNAPRQSMVEG